MKLGPMASITLKIVIARTRAQACKGKKPGIGGYGKHQSKNCKFLVHQQRPPMAKIGTLGPMAIINLRI